MRGSSPVPKILYVDDDADSRELLTVYLQMSDIACDIRTAASAEEAIPLVERDSFDLYILDNMLPNLTGIDFCRYIRANYPNVPIIFFSAVAQPHDRYAASLAGADIYLVKPNDLEDLPIIVQSLLKTTNAAAQAG
jgi:DNA-binding response OmpR family regulator